MIRGYARVSTDGQSLDAQVKRLRAAGAEEVWRETTSGAKSDRVQLRRVLAQLGSGDVLLVTKLDRLARSTRDLLNVLAVAARSANACHGIAPRSSCAGVGLDLMACLRQYMVLKV